MTHLLTNSKGSLVDNVLIGLRVAGLVGNVPTKRFEERVDKFQPDLSLVVGLAAVGLDVLIESPYQLYD